jgi:hypothetical protein
MLDANNASGSTIGPGVTCGSGPCKTEAEGVPFNCATAKTSTVTGGAIVGFVPGFDTTLGDVVTGITFVAQ